MARIRTIKPQFFKNEELSEIKFEYRLLFIGLWTVADREGRLKDRPKTIKGELFPHDTINIEKGLQVLSDAGLIIRYEATVAGKSEKFIQIPTFLEHQKPHFKELPSTYPAPTQVVVSPSLDGWIMDNGHMDNRNGEREGSQEDSAKPSVDDYVENLMGGVEDAPEPETLPGYFKPSEPYQPPKPIIPTIEEVKMFFTGAGSTESVALKFFNHHEAKAWMIGFTPVLAWRALATNWIAGETKPQQGGIAETAAERHKRLTHGR